MAAVPLLTDDVIPWEWVPALLVGCLFAALVFLVGVRSGHRKQRAGPPPPPAPPVLRRDPFLEGSAADRREAARRSGNPVGVLLYDAAGRRELGRGLVLDRSLGGIALLAEGAVQAGAVVGILAAGAPVTAVPVQVVVKTTRREGRGYRLGCQFVRPPSWGDRIQFG